MGRCRKDSGPGLSSSAAVAMDVWVTILGFVLWLAWLAWERVGLERSRAKIPLRVAVTGTRGKTSVVRLLAAVLREDGRRVWAKTTGSEARVILPDGSEEEVRRVGAPTILEQRRFLARAARARAEAVVVEVMSVQPEAHAVESPRIVVPQWVLVTNFRVDHLAAQGESREAVARVLALGVPRGARALVPQGEWEEAFRDEVVARGGVVEPVAPGTASGPGPPGGEEGLAFPSNLDLVWWAARALGVEEEVIRRGLTRARGDVGALRWWEYPSPGGKGCWRVVNAFAANDPESTWRVYRRVGAEPASCVGLLALRGDRGDRTALWAEALAEGFLDLFRRVYVVGRHARALEWRVQRALRRRGPGGGGAGAGPRLRVLPEAPAPALMRRILAAEGEAEGLLFGFGNIGGTGEFLVRHWETAGTPLPLPPSPAESVHDLGNHLDGG